jgi:predicted HTH domain antitoxin
MSKKHVGSSIDAFLKEEGVFEESQAQAVKEVVAWQRGTVSLGHAARIAGKSLPNMMEMLTHMGVPIVKVSGKDIEHDLATLDAWKAARSS